MKSFKFFRFFVILALVFPCAFAAMANGLQTVAPAKVGLSAERLERITNAMQADVDAGRIPGALGLVARHGKVAYFETVGEGDMEKNRAMQPDTIFRLYSMSKPITSVALMTLFEQGKFLLKDPVSKFLPELGGLEVAIEDEPEAQGRVFNIPEEGDTLGDGAIKQPDTLKTVHSDHDMTVQDLLRHTSGLTYGFFGNTAVDKLYQRAGILIVDKDIKTMVAKLGKIPLKHQPGTTWEYSVSVDVIGRLIEVLSGQDFDDFLAEHIFEPLEMNDTGFYTPKEKMDRMSQLYSPNDDGGIKLAPAYYSRNFVNAPTLFSGGGGMVSTASDYLRFCQMLLNGGELEGVRILGRKTIELMTSDHTLGLANPRTGTGYGFGLGFAVAKDIGQIALPVSPGEYNWGGAAGTKFWIDPVEDMIGIYMVQILPHTNLQYGTQFKALAYQAIVD